MASHARKPPRKPASQRRLPPGHGIGPDLGLGIGTRRAHMKPAQRQATADWAANAAGGEFWKAQGAAQRGDTVAAAGHMAAADGLRAEAAKLRETLH